MTMKEATKILLENTCTETIEFSVQTPDYFEFVCTCGGDVMRFRVYEDGSVYEK